MSNTNFFSGLGQLNNRDLWRSLLMVVLGAVAMTLWEFVDKWFTDEPFTKADVWLSFKAGCVAGGANIVKQLLTNGRKVEEKALDAAAPTYTPRR